MGLSIFTGRRILNYIVGLSIKDVLILANSTDSDKCCISSESSLFPKVPVYGFNAPSSWDQCRMLFISVPVLVAQSPLLERPSTPKTPKFVFIPERKAVAVPEESAVWRS